MPFAQNKWKFCTQARITLHPTAPAEIRASLHMQALNKRIFFALGWISGLQLGF